MFENAEQARKALDEAIEFLMMEDGYTRADIQTLVDDTVTSCEDAS